MIDLCQLELGMVARFAAQHLVQRCPVEEVTEQRGPGESPPVAR